MPADTGDRDPNKAYVEDTEVEPGTSFAAAVRAAMRKKGYESAHVMLNGAEIDVADAPATLAAGDVVRITPYDRAAALAPPVPETVWRSRKYAGNKKARVASARQSALNDVVETVTPAATQLLRSGGTLASLAEHMAAIIRDVVAEGAPFSNVNLDVITDMETPAWSELVFTIEVRADFEEMMQWWRKIGAYRAELNQHLPENERNTLARNIGVHLVSEG